jgi:hypothetical protein
MFVCVYVCVLNILMCHHNVCVCFKYFNCVTIMFVCVCMCVCVLNILIVSPYCVCMCVCVCVFELKLYTMIMMLRLGDIIAYVYITICITKSSEPSN